MMTRDKQNVKRTDRKDRQIRISFFHLAAFLFVYAVNALLFLIFRGYFFLVTGMILTALVPFSFFTAWRLALSVEAYVSVEKDALCTGEENRVVFFVDNPGWLCALRSTWFLETGNSFYETFDSHRLVLSIPPRGRKMFPMPLTLTDLGQIVFRCQKFAVTDLLGIFSIYSMCNAAGSFCVLPGPDAGPASPLPVTGSGTTELAESRQKGNDHSEISDIRTYRPGDRPRDIHWKLSARQRELMAKERVTLSGSEQVLLLELPTAKKSAERLLTEGYGLIKRLLDSPGTIRLLVWDNTLFSFESYSCSSPEELDAAYHGIFHAPLSSRTCSSLKQYMKNCYPRLDSYLCITGGDETVQLETCING